MSPTILPTPSVLHFITFPFDDETWRHLVAKYWQKETLLDADLLEEYVINQPLLTVTCLLLFLLSAFIFISSIIFVGCRSLGKCGAKRYQPHPTSGKRYSFYLSVFLLSWCIIATASLYFIFSGISFWNQKVSSERLSSKNLTLVRFTPNTYYDRKIQKRSPNEPSVSEMFSDLDYDGDFEKIDMQTTQTTTSEPRTTLTFDVHNYQQKSKVKVLNTASLVLPASKPLRSVEIPLRPNAETAFITHPLAQVPPIYSASKSIEEFDDKSIADEEKSYLRGKSKSGPTKLEASFVSNKVGSIGRAADKDIFRTSGLASGLSMSSYVPSRRKVVRNEGLEFEEPDDSGEIITDSIVIDSIPETSPLPDVSQFDLTSTEYFADPEVSQEVTVGDDIEFVTTMDKSPIESTLPIVSSSTTTATTTTTTTTYKPTTTILKTEAVVTTTMSTTTQSPTSTVVDAIIVDKNEDQATELVKIDEIIPTTTTRNDAPTSTMPSFIVEESTTIKTVSKEEEALPIPIFVQNYNTSTENNTDSGELLLSVGGNGGIEWHVDTVPFENKPSTLRPTLIFPTEYLTDYDLQAKIEQVSSTPYPYRILHTPAVIWMARISFILISALIVINVFPSLFLIIIGTVCYLHSFHPVDRSKISDKIGSLLILLSTIQLFSVPLLLCFSAFTLIYVHAHDVLCPAIQMQYLHQMGALDSRITINSAAFIDRQVANSDNCRQSLAPVEGLLYSSLLLAIFSLPVVFSLFKVTKYFLRMKTEYYWSMGDNYGSIRRQNVDEIYGPIYGEIRNKRPRPPAPPPPAYQDNHNHIYTESIYNDGPIYGVYSTYGQI